MMKRIVSLLLTFSLLFSFIPVGSLNVYAAETPTNGIIDVQDAYGKPGSEVEVAVLLKNNPGILAMTLEVTYDESKATLKSVENGDALSYMTSFTKPKNLKSGCKLPWATLDIDDVELKDGVLVTLTFEISPSAKENEKFNINLSYDWGAIIDNDTNPISVNINNGYIQALSYTPGDVNDDGYVNTTDVVYIMRHIAGGYDISLIEAAANVNGDEYINTTDVVYIMRYIAGGYGVILLPSPQKCDHELKHIPEKAAGCLEDGNIGYYHCSLCGNYYKDAAGNIKIELEDTVIKAKGEHTIVIDPAVAPTPTTPGLTEGSHCSVCGDVIIKQEEVGYPEDKKHNVTYNISNGDNYLASQEINNSNQNSFAEDEVVVLKNISVPGYKFLGWFDGAGDNAAQIKRIELGTTNDIELYAHWEKIEYKVQFKSSIFLEENELTYTVDTGAVLPTPKLSNYIFVGWTDEDGNLYEDTVIPKGTTESIILTANWTSERNKTWTKPVLDAPIIEIDENNNVILFAYEIGMIENIPLYTIKDFGYISGDGVTKTQTETYSFKIEESLIDAYTRAVSNATTQSSNWTLSKDWNETTSIDSEWAKENGYTQEEAESIGKSKTDTWNVSSGSSGSKETTNLSENQSGWTNTVKGSLDITAGGKIKGIVELSGTLGFEAQGTKTETELESESTKKSSSWNSSSSYSESETTSENKTISNAISEKICSTYGYGKSYVNGGASSSSQGLSSTQSASDEYATSVTYSTATTKEVTSTWTTQATKPGYHRWVMAGTAHVFAVVGYDMATDSYFVYTYSVLDDEIKEFEDYSYTSSNYDDEQNGVISFEVPFDVAEYVADLTCYSNGLKIDQTTGEISGYTGIDNCAVIPEYMNVGNGKVVKVVGIKETAFKNNRNIVAVVFSNFIEKLPDNAFSGCVSLCEIIEGNLKTIGKRAFSGCESLVDYEITNEIIYLGENAFDGVERVVINASNAGVLEAAADSGAKKIELHVEKMENCPDSLIGKTLTIPDTSEYFEFNGDGHSYTDLNIVSDAGKTVIKDAKFVCSKEIPLKTSSPEVILDAVSLEGNGFAMVLSAENTNLGLQGTISVKSNNENALLSKNISLYEYNKNVDGRLNVQDNIFICGSITGAELAKYKALKEIGATEFENMLSSYTLYFDTDGGVCSETSRLVPNGTPIRELPAPTKDYHKFIGWYLGDGVTKVTAETVFADGLDKTIYAHWEENPPSDWVLASDMPEDAQLVNTKWTHTLKSYTESNSPELEGWTLYNTTSDWGEYGEWSEWNKTAVAGSESREVETKDEHTGYNMVTYNTMSNYGDREFRSFSIDGKYSQYGCSSEYGQHNYKTTATISKINSATKVAEGKYTSECSFPGYNKGKGTGYIISYSGKTMLFFIESNIYTKYYRYRDRELVSIYHFFKEEIMESESYPTGDNISNIQQWVQYREK